MQNGASGKPGKPGKRKKGKTQVAARENKKSKRPSIASPPFEEIIPAEILTHILRDYVHPWGSELARLVCHRWDTVVEDYFREERVARCVETVAKLRSHRIGKLCDGATRGVPSEYSDVEIGYFQSIGRIMGGMGYSSGRSLGYHVISSMTTHVMDVVVSFPRKNAGDHIVQMMDHVPASMIRWLHKNGALRFPLPLFYIIRRDDAESLTTFTQALCSKEPKHLKVIVMCSINLIARFSAKECMKAMTNQFLFNTSVGVPFAVWGNMLRDSAIFNGNLEFLKHVVGPKRMEDAEYVVANLGMMRAAEHHRKYEIIRWLAQRGMKLESPVNLFRHVLEDGDDEMTTWMLEHEGKRLQGSICVDGGSLGTFVLRGKNSTRVWRSTAQPWVMNNAVKGMNPRVIKTIRKHMDFPYGPPHFHLCMKDRYGHTAEEHIRMMDYLMEDLPLSDVFSEDDAAFLTILETFATEGWIEEIEWLKNQDKPWIEVKTALVRGNFDLFNWYLTQLGTDIKGHWFTEDDAYHKLAVEGRVDVIQRMFEEFGFKRSIGVVIPGAMMGGHPDVLDWLWSHRDELCTEKKDWIAWTVYSMWAKHLDNRAIRPTSTGEFFCDTSRSRIDAWFETVARSDPRMQEITSADVIALGEEEWTWRTIIQALLAETPKRTQLEVMLGGGGARTDELTLFIEFSGVKDTPK
jgi:hypothetical protein